MNDHVAGQIIEAYKSNPVLTGLLLLNVGLFLGMGYYIVKVQQATGVFVGEMQKELVELAKECGGRD